MELKRFIIRTKDRKWIASVYATDFVPNNGRALNGSTSGTFYAGDKIVAQTSDEYEVLVDDSGGRLTVAA